MHFIALCVFATIWLACEYSEKLIPYRRTCVRVFLKRQWTDIILAGPLDVRNVTLSSKVRKSLGIIKIHSPGHEISSSACIMMKMTHFFALTHVSLIANIRKAHGNSILSFEFTVQQCKASLYTLKIKG